jgi:hypothetical protein
MLPSYVVFFCGIGAGYMLGLRIGAAPMLRFADRIMPIEVWGGVFFTCGILMIVAMLAHHRTLYRYALLVCATSMAVWLAVALLGVFYAPVTYTAWLWPFIVMQACRASNRSLVRGELDRPGG